MYKNRLYRVVTRCRIGGGEAERTHRQCLVPLSQNDIKFIADELNKIKGASWSTTVGEVKKHIVNFNFLPTDTDDDAVGYRFFSNEDGIDQTSIYINRNILEKDNRYKLFCPRYYSRRINMGKTKPARILAKTLQQITAERVKYGAYYGNTSNNQRG
jgi:hypothetical protein